MRSKKPKTSADGRSVSFKARPDHQHGARVGSARRQDLLGLDELELPLPESLTVAHDTGHGFQVKQMAGRTSPANGVFRG
jgi:hypothetical protein